MRYCQSHIEIGESVNTGNMLHYLLAIICVGLIMHSL